MGAPLLQGLFTVASMAYQSMQKRKQKKALQEEQRRMKDRAATRDVRLSGSNVPGRFIYGFARTGGDVVFTHVIDGFAERLIVDSDIEVLGALTASDTATKKNEVLVLQRVLGFAPLTSVLDADIDDQPLIILDEDGFIDRLKAQPYYDFFRSEIDLKGNRNATTTRSDIIADFEGQGLSNANAIIKTNEILPETSVFKDWSYSTELLKMNQNDPQFSSKPDVSYFVQGRKVKTILQANDSDTFYISTDSEFSNNAIKCLLDYCVSEWGPNFNYTDIDLRNWYSNIQKAEMIVQENAPVSGRIHNALNTINSSEFLDTDFSMTLTLRGVEDDDNWNSRNYNINEYFAPDVVKLQGTYSITVLERGSSYATKVVPAYVRNKTQYSPIRFVGSSITGISASRTTLAANGDRIKIRIDGTAQRRIPINTNDRLTGTIRHNGGWVALRNLQIAKYDFVNDTEGTTFITPSNDDYVYLARGTRIFTSYGYIVLLRDKKINNGSIDLRNKGGVYDFRPSTQKVSGHQDNDEQEGYGTVSFTEVKIGNPEPLTATRDIKKHEFNGSIDSSSDHISNISTILDTIPGALMFRDVNGKIKLSIPDERISTEAHSVDTVTDSEIIGEVKVSTPDSNERLNHLTIDFANASKDFASDSYTFIDRNAYLNYDNNTILSSSLNLTGVSSKYHAEYIARTTVNESRRNLYSWKESHRGIFKEPGDVVLLTPTNRGIRTQEDSEGTGVFVRITSQKLNSDLTINFEGYEFDIADYTYNKQVAEARELHKDFNFSVEPPTNLNVTADNNTTVSIPPVTINWTNSVDTSVIEYFIEFTDSYQGDTDLDSETQTTPVGVSNWIPVGTAGKDVQTFKFIPPTTNTSSASDYAIKIRAKTTSNRFSDYAYLTDLTNPIINEFADGVDGDAFITISLYQNSATSPTVPLVTAGYDTDGNPEATGNWTISPSNPGNTEFTWRTNITLRRPNNTGNWQSYSSNWVSPERLTGTTGTNGINGVSGFSARIDIAYFGDSDGTDASYPSGTLSATNYTLATRGTRNFQGTNVVNWTQGDTETAVSNTASDYEITKITGDDGTDGVNGLSNRIDFAYANSDNGDSDFNTDYFADALYIGTDVVSYTAGTTPPAQSTTNTDYEWSRLRGVDGIPGSNGSDGVNTAAVYAYKRSSSTLADTDKPDTTRTWTFSSGSFDNNDLGNGWTANIPTGTNDLYFCVAVASDTDSTDSVVAADWSSPQLLASNGTDGSNATNTAVVYAYKWGTAVATDKPNTTRTYTFSTSAWSDTNGGNSWTLSSIPAKGANTVLSVCSAIASSVNSTDDVVAADWTSAQILAQDGTDGTPGNNAYGGAISLTGSTIFLQEEDAGWPTTQSTVTTISFSNGTNTHTETYTVSIDSEGALSGSVSNDNANITVATNTSNNVLTATWTHSSGVTISQQYEAKARSPRQTVKVVYYSIAQQTAPANPTATSINFNTGAVAGLTANWSTTNVQVIISSTTLLYWQAELLFTESVYGGSQTVTVLQAPQGRVTFGDDIASDNYVTGTSGWIIRRDTGSAEFQDVVVRGTLNADDITAGTLSLERINNIKILNDSDGTNIGIGEEALQNITSTAIGNHAFGYRAGGHIDTGDQNVFMGVAAGYYNRDASYNVAIGVAALESVPTGFGYGNGNTAGNYNVAIGYKSGSKMASGLGSSNRSINNITIGTQTAVVRNTDYNYPKELIALGTRAGASVFNASNCIAIGVNSLDNINASNLSGSNNIAIGNSSLRSVNNAMQGNVGVGAHTGPDTDLLSYTTCIGHGNTASNTGQVSFDGPSGLSTSIILPNKASAPSTTRSGTVYYDTLTSSIRFYSTITGVWKSLRGEETYGPTNHSGNFTPFFHQYVNFIINATGNINLINTTLGAFGQTGLIVIYHSGGARTVSLGSYYDTPNGAGLTLSTTAGAYDIIPYFKLSSTVIKLGNPILNIS